MDRRISPGRPLQPPAPSADAKAIVSPDSPPLRLRQALALITQDRLLEAIAALRSLTRDVPQAPSAWQALGAALRMADDVPGAAEAFDTVLRLRPADPLARLSRAQVAADRGRPSVDLYRAALACDPASTAARLGLAVSLANDGSADAAAEMVRAWLAREPGWAEGWTALASLNHRWRGSEAFMSAARAMFDADQDNAALMLAAIHLLARTGEHGAALDWVGEARARTGDSPPLQLAEAESLDAIGEHQAAAAILGRLAPLREPAVDLARLRHALRAAKPEQAAAIAERMLDGPGRAAAWPYLGTAWRLLGDARWQGLDGDDRLVSSRDIGLSAAELAALAERLRLLHRARHAPFEQSMRGGTQTEGTLLSRDEPEIRRLRAALIDAVRAHIDGLPPVDPRHPTLAPPRQRFRFSGSWSVRLAGGGHHVNHVHSEGWLSSACYIALPPQAGDAGALTLGEPPSDLGTGLKPVRVIAPTAGRLVLFPSIMWHGTQPFAAGERLTVAFDVRPLV